MKSKIWFGVIVATLIFVRAAIGERSDEVRYLQSEKVYHYQVLGKTSIPRLINYQGYLTDAGGNPINDTLEMTFSIWDAPVGGNQLWSEVITSVPVIDGLFGIELGDITPIPDSAFFGVECWLQTKVETETLSPRKQIVSVGYSFKAYQADVAELAQLAELASYADTAGYAHSVIHAVSADHASYADSTGVASYASDADKLDGQHLSDLDSWYVNEGQSNSITSTMIMDGTIQQVDLAFSPGSGDGHSLDATDGDPVDAVYVDTAGNVGIGTTSPRVKLSLGTDIKSKKLALWDGVNDFYGFGVDWGRIIIHTNDTEKMTILDNGNVGIGIMGPQEKLHVSGVARFDLNAGQINVSTPGGWPGIIAYAPNGNRRDVVYSDYGVYIATSSSSSPPSSKNGIMIRENGNLGVGTTDPNEKLHVAGTAKCDVLKITGGSDIAEPFDIKEADKIKAGTVLTIDSENPGKLKISEKAYDRCVAGIVSGAGGINPGLMITQEDVFEGNHQVALAGRVYGLCDASYGSIEPGDLLTTSPSPGYAMKVTDYGKAQGAIIGKAMGSLEDGQGLVLVLVTLQ